MTKKVNSESANRVNDAAKKQSKKQSPEKTPLQLERAQHAAEIEIGRGQVVALGKSVHFYLRVLESLAAKNAALVDEDNGKVVSSSLAAVGTALQKITRADKLFHISAFTRDSLGRSCVIRTKKVCPKWGVDVVSVSAGCWEYLAPVQLSLVGVYNAISYIIKQDDKIRAQHERAAKSHAKSLNKAQKLAENEMRAAAVALARGEMTQDAFNEIYTRCSKVIQYGV